MHTRSSFRLQQGSFSNRMLKMLRKGLEIDEDAKVEEEPEDDSTDDKDEKEEDDKKEDGKKEEL